MIFSGVPFSAARWNMIIANELSLREAILQVEDGWLYKAQRHSSNPTKEWEITQINVANGIDDADLPTHTAYLSSRS
jgi:hypothetical protein